jgi:hypothetical protein
MWTIRNVAVPLSLSTDINEHVSIDLKENVAKLKLYVEVSTLRNK